MKTPSVFLLAATLVLPLVRAAGEPQPNPLIRGEGIAPAKMPGGPQVLSICFETFSLDLANAAVLYRKMTSDAKLYEEIVARVAQGEATQESFTVLRVRSGEKAVNEGISEQIYPTEYEAALTFNQFSLTNPDEVPSPVPVPPAGNLAAQQKYFAPVRPKSFETRSTGLTLEVEPTVAADQPIVDLRLVPEFVALVDRVKFGQGISETEVPIFECQRTNTATTMKLGLPHLISTMNRPPVSKIDADSAKRIWFAFVTVDLVTH
jgi:hypothetical protein